MVWCAAPSCAGTSTTRRSAEDLAAEVAKLRVQVAYRGSAIVTFLLGGSFANIANRIFYVPCFHYFAVVFRIARIFAHEH